MIAHQIGPIASALVPNIASIVTPVAMTITNPGAESALTGWTTTGALTSSTAQTNGTPRSGTKLFYNGATGQYSTMAQTLAIPSSAYFGVDNNAYNFVFNRYANCQTTGAGGSYMIVDFLDSTGALIERTQTAYKTVTQNTWTLLTETLLCPPGTRNIKVTLVLRNIGGSSSTLRTYLDDFDASLVQVANTAKIDFSTLSALMGSRRDAVAVREANVYAVLGSRLDTVNVKQADLYAIFGSPRDRLAVRDARAYFILTP